MRKWLLVLAGVVLAAAAILLAALRLPAYLDKLARGRLIDREHCERIKEGISQAEVEGALGGPPGDFHTVEPIYYPDYPADWVGKLRLERWDGDEGEICVTFDAQGVVQSRSFAPATKPSLAQRLRAWLRRLWP